MTELEEFLLFSENDRAVNFRNALDDFVVNTTRLKLREPSYMEMLIKPQENNNNANE